MYSTEDFTEIDKTNFKCFRFPDNSIYYGEVIYLTPDNTQISDPNQITDEEVKAELKLVRHGMGAQFFGVESVKATCQYEGEWNLDKKHGKGTAHFQDGSSYEGEFKDDKFWGIGKFIWKAGHVYIGTWKDGRMEGEGEFKHQDGHILRGFFVNNYMLDKEKGIYLDPFLSAENADKFKEDNEQYEIQMKSNQIRYTKDNVVLVYNQDEIFSLMDDCINVENKTPLLIRTIERRVDKEEIFSYLPYEKVEIDLKQFYQDLRKVRFDSPEMRQVYEDMKVKIMDAMTNGKFLILNYDDSKSDFDELFEPEIKEMYKNFMLSPLIWTPKTFSLPNNFKAHTNNKEGVALHPNFKFIVYSKYLITDVNADQQQISEIIKKKFDSSFPLKFIKIFVLSKMKVEEKKNEGEEAKVEEVKEEPKNDKKAPATKAKK